MSNYNEKQILHFIIIIIIIIYVQLQLVEKCWICRLVTILRKPILREV